MFASKLTSLLLPLLLLWSHLPPAATEERRGPRPPPSYATRTVAGVAVVDTPLVRAAQAYARAHSSAAIFAHVMRSWLFGALLISHDEGLRAAVDLEVHAVAALLHDLGWDMSSSSSAGSSPGSAEDGDKDVVVSPDRRFEVDGAIAARAFIRGHADGERWEERRVQLVWDAVALHTERRIAYFKELDVQVVSRGVALDFDGPAGSNVTADEYAAVVREFAKDDLARSVNETIVWLCQTKPASTYDTWMQPWGDRFVANYSANLKGKQRIDTIFSKL